jgi:hypothetical protein
MTQKCLIPLLFLSLLLGTVFSQELIYYPSVKQRGFNAQSFQKSLNSNLSKKNKKVEIPKKETFKSSLTFVNRKPENSYFPLEKDKPSLVFRMTWAF